MTELTVDIVREFLDYNPETGEFRWKFRDRKHFESVSDQPWNTWNSRYANTVTGCLNKITGYRQIRIFGKNYQAHRLAWFHHYGEWPKNEIDHINRIKDDNRLENLRTVSVSQNGMNRSIRSGTSSQYKGVYWNNRDNKWQAQIKINDKRKYLGLFISEEDAARAYDLAALKYYGEYASLNFSIRKLEDHRCQII